MKSLVIISLITVSFSINAAMASPNMASTSDLNQIFSEQGKIAELSPQEMQATEGRYSILAALLDLADDHDGVDSDGDGRDSDNTDHNEDHDGRDSDGDGRDDDHSGVDADGVDSDGDGIDDGFGDLAHYFSAETWAAIVAGITDGSFRLNPEGFLRDLGIDPNFVVSASDFNTGDRDDDHDDDRDDDDHDNDRDNDRDDDHDNDRDDDDR